MDNGERQLLTDIIERLGRLEGNTAEQGTQIQENTTNIAWLIKRLNHTSRRNLAIACSAATVFATGIIKLGNYIADKLF